MATPTSRFDPQQAKRVSRYFLVMVLGALLTAGGLNIYWRFGPAYVYAKPIPHGLEPGSRIRRAHTPPDPVSVLSPTAHTEFIRAQELEQAGQYKKAYEVWSNLAANNPDLLQGTEGLSRCLLLGWKGDSSRTGDVENYARRLEASAEGKASAWYLRALLLETRGQFVESREWLSRAVTEAPAHPAIRLALSQRFLAAGEFDRAITEARTGITLTEGRDPAFYALLALAYHDRGELDSCGSVVEFAASRFPSDPGLLSLRGLLYEYRGKFEDAEAAYRRVLSLNPLDSIANEALRTLGEKSPPGSRAGGGSVLTPRDRAQLAVEIIEPLVQQYPENTVIRYALGQALLKARQFDLARTHFEEVHKQDPQFPDIQLRLQEASASPATASRDVRLGETALRNLDALRKQDTRSSSEKLGHYLARWGVSPKEFFTQYNLDRFQRIDSTTWRETFFESPLFHQYTAMFDEKGLWGVHILVQDSSYTGKPGAYFDLFGRLLSMNSRISGVGTATGEAECPDGGGFQAVVWDTRDNFELLVQSRDNKAEARIIRLARRKVPPSGRLCDYLASAKLY